MHRATCTTQEMRAWEINSQSLGVPTRLLMENAGAAVARVVAEQRPKSVSIVAGTGGKAGDGFVAARHLAAMGINVRVYLVYRRENIKHPDAVDALRALEASGVEVNEDYWRWGCSSDWLDADIIIDAMLGTGLRGEVRSPYREIINQLNAAGATRVAIDVPSGLDPDTGRVHGAAVKAHLTVTMHCVKRGLVEGEGPRYAGRIIVANIGLPRDAWLYIGPGDLEVLAPRRREWARKGEAGRVLVVGGSAEFHGAPWIAALAAFYAGADLVYLAAPEPVFATIHSPEVIPVRLQGQRLRINHVEELEAHLERVDAVLVGPGLGLHPETSVAARLIVKKAVEKGKIIVIDADALKALKNGETPRDTIEGLGGLGILTPHAGEASLLLGGVKLETLEDRVAVAQRIAEMLDAHVILKGRVDVVAHPDGSYRLNRTGTPDMTAGGTGDVLAGVTAGLAAETRDAKRASILAPYVTGLAGEKAVEEWGRAAPTLLIREVSRILARVRYK